MTRCLQVDLLLWLDVRVEPDLPRAPLQVEAGELKLGAASTRNLHRCRELRMGPTRPARDLVDQTARKVQ